MRNFLLIHCVVAFLVWGITTCNSNGISQTVEIESQTENNTSTITLAMTFTPKPKLTYTSTPIPSTTPTHTLTPPPTLTGTLSPPKEIPLSASDILDSDKMIEYSYKLFEQEWSEFSFSVSRDYSAFAPIQYPSGQVGSFVTVCCVDGLQLGGTTYLYRAVNEKAELVHQGETGPAHWGAHYTFTDELEWEKTETEIEFLPLFDDIDDQIVKITGHFAAGTGNTGLSMFNIIRITDNGPQSIFGATEVFVHVSTYDFELDIGEGDISKRQHKFIDIDGDGRKEIIESYEKCFYEIPNWNPKDWTKQSCEEEEITYKFSGERYEPSE